MSYGFPFLFGGTFIEGASAETWSVASSLNFPSFSEGLSLRGGLNGAPVLGLCIGISLPFRRDFH